MWHRTDSFRQGRVKPLARIRCRAVHAGGSVLSFDLRQASVALDFTQGAGELLTSTAYAIPGLGKLPAALATFQLSTTLPYDFGLVTQLLNEVHEVDTFHTGSVRNVYSPDVRCAAELLVDEVARGMGRDALRFRRDFAKDDRMRAVIDAVAKAGPWGRKLGPGRAQGIAIHSEYKSRAACLVEIDCRPRTVGREVEHGFTGPRVTRVVYAVDVGLAINPMGLRAQMMGGIVDGIGQALTYGLHLRDGAFLEGSWDDAFYPRQWNVPPKVEILVMPPTTGKPGGAGEFGVAASMAATACAYARATGTVPTTFPINHRRVDLGFAPFPTVPPIPASPTDGRRKAVV